jgi:hypothetical protein
MWSRGCDYITTEVVWTTEFSGLQIDNSLNWKEHNEYIINKSTNQVQHASLWGVTSLTKIDK